MLEEQEEKKCQILINDLEEVRPEVKWVMNEGKEHTNSLRLT